VTETFERTGAHLMVSVLPPEQLRLKAIPLPALEALLVVHRDHPLARRKGVSIAELQAHPILTVRGSNPRLQLSTSSLEQRSTIHLNDFHTKKEAILAKMGFGWMPREMIERELARGLVTKVRWEQPSVHLFRPQIYHRADAALGRGARAVVRGLQSQAS
jgi:DNA-binding transcriptional LysR family regulator